MTTIQRLPLPSRLGSALVLPAGPPGSGPGHPGGATQRGRWRFRAAGPARLALAGATVPPAAVPPAMVPPATVPPATVPPATVPPATVPTATVPPAAARPRTAGHRAGTSVAHVRGLAP